ncbi:LamG domain-containing protein [Candidatus Pacearchaeota archaeon]|nr:LamG domain-containing protein [Candidatus Pacearchaeota archaeon]
MKKEAFQYIWFFVILVSIGLVLLGSFSILGFLVFNPSGELTTDPSVVLLTHMNGNVLDNSGNNNQGNIIGNVDCNVQGKFNQGCGFDSQSEYITIPDSGSLDLTNALTISAWVYPKGSTGRTQAIAYKYASYGLTLNNNLYAFAEMCYTTGNCNNNVQSSNQLTTNQWHHVVFTFDGANLKIYVDGVLAGTRARQGVIQKTNTNLQIGLVSNWNFNGAIDELVVFNRALSESEILELYNAQPSQTQPPQTCTENWQCSSWDSCVDDIQTRTCLDNNNCGTINNKPVTTQACTTPMQDATQPTCQENWQCNVWSACINGKQVRECIDINNCGTTNNLPQVQRDCQLQECRENWECTAFGSCVDGLQERFCIEKNNCGTTNNKPITTQPCTEEGIIQKLTGQEECEIKRVEWTDLNGNRKDTALNGETVYLTVETENCEGKAVDYNILETDGVFGVEEEDKDSGVVINGKARKSYAARWKEDKVLGIFPGGDPDLFFRAKINPEGTSNVLTVLQQEAGALIMLI